jgi:hypothetical protein
MSSIVLDAKLIEAFRNCADSTVLRDQEGNVVGFFEPPLKLYEEAEIPELDEAEIERRIQRWRGISSAEVRRQLEQLR